MHNIWENIKEFILRLFGKKPTETDKQIRKNKADVQNYIDIASENITAIVANKLSIIAFGDSDISITGDNKRAEFLQTISNKLNFKRISTSALGTGLIASIPYSLGGKIYINTVMKDRIFITSTQGDEITGCTVLADVIKTENSVYTRWTDYSVENTIYIIRQRCTCDGKPVPLDSRTEWAGISEEIRIAGVERLPIGIMRCPASDRRPQSIGGCPITYGCGATLNKIAKTLSDIEDEFDLKKVFVGADETMFDGDGKIPTSRLFKTFIGVGDTKDFWQIFDPAFRETAYFTKLTQHFAMLEKEIGCSKGILTELETQNATATEIRREMYDTFCLCDDIHKEFKKYYADLMYGVNVLCNYFSVTPQGEYDIDFDWSYALLEDSDSTFNQLERGKNMGAVDVSEVRHFIFPDETLEESAGKCEEIKKNNPTLSQLIGE